MAASSRATSAPAWADASAACRALNHNPNCRMSMQIIISAGASKASSTTLEPRSERTGPDCTGHGTRVNGARSKRATRQRSITVVSASSAVDLGALGGDEVLDDEEQRGRDAENDGGDDGQFHRGCAGVVRPGRRAQVRPADTEDRK